MARPRIFDADTHVTEPADVWTARMSSNRWGELVPHVKVDDGWDCWFVGDKRIAAVSSSSYVRRDPSTGEKVRVKPGATDNRFASGYAELHESSFDAQARLAAMDDLGIGASVVYPNLNLVTGDLHEAVSDPAYGRDVIRAYNDWIAEWCSIGPTRLLPLGLVAYWDATTAAEEIYRCKELGHRGLVMTGVPHRHGHPPLASRSWDPLWRAAEETQLPIGFHVGANEDMKTEYINAARLGVEGPAAMGARTTTALFFDNAGALNDLLLSGVLPRFPKLKFVIVETGVGWVNFCLEAVDYHFKRYAVHRERPEFTEVPSYYFKRQIYTTYWFESMDPFYVARVGANNILFETDYPHVTSLDASDIDWTVDQGLAMLSNEDRERVLWRNAATLYGLEA